MTTATMNTTQLLDEIRETNLAYLMLAQNMVRQDRAMAQYRLGINADVAEIIEGLSPGQMLKMAASNLLMCRFRFDDEMVWKLITSHSTERDARTAHAGILMAGNLAEVV